MFPIQVHQSVRSFFYVAVISEVGNGRNTLFWTDNWVHGQSLAKLVRNLFGGLSSRAKKRTMFDATTDLRWVGDIRGALTVTVWAGYLGVWDLTSLLVLQPEVEDSHIWRFSASGQYSSKSAYEAMFIGAIQFGAWERIWQIWAPGKCKFFMWLVAHDRCWTADRLTRRNLPHPDKCPLCDQEETINHLLVSCVFSCQFWFIILQKFGLHALAPQTDNHSFDDWWEQASRRVDGQNKKGAQLSYYPSSFDDLESSEWMCV
jgi:hypothetical protein